MDNKINTGKPARQPAERLDRVTAAFVTPDFLNAVSSSNADLAAVGAYEAIREFMTPREMAFAWGIGNALRGSLHVNKVVDDTTTTTIFANAKDSSELEYHILPMVNSDLFKKEILAYLNGYPDNQPDEKPYELVLTGTSLLIGVKPGFLQFLEKKAHVASFYRDCLELCLTRVREDALRGTELYSQFVSQTLYF